MSQTAPTLRPLDYRRELQAPGTKHAPYEAVLQVAELPLGAMRRVTRGDLDILLANTPAGIVATDDRCPHMSAPLSVGDLDECVVACPLHEGRFDLAAGEIVQMPTTGGLDPDGRYHPVWTASGHEPKSDVPGRKAEARRFTRVRRLRYYPLRIRDGRIEIAVPVLPGAKRSSMRETAERVARDRRARVAKGRRTSFSSG